MARYEYIVMDLRPLIARWLLILVTIGGAEAQAQTALTPAASDRPETRKPRIASPSRWPHACSLITLEDVEQVFSGKTVRPFDKLIEVVGFLPMLTLTAPKTEDPKYCHFWVAWTEEVDGQQGSSIASVGLTIEHMVESLEVAHKYYNYSRIDGGADADIAGLGDEASISPANELFLRKGLLTVRLNVPAGASNRSADGEGRRWATELARRVTARMP